MREARRYVLTPRARRDMRRLELSVRQRVFDALDLYAGEGHGDVAKLQGRVDEWRLRVGDWRVRFRRDAQARVVVVLRVLPRSQAYRR